jgi:hypothetical protein
MANKTLSPLVEQALGFTLTDINVGIYAEASERGATHGSMAPRGASVPPETPSLGCYDIADKATVWAENAGELYEEAVARQWSSARDIPWEKREPLPEEIERAVSQLCTQLTEVEFITADLPAKWMWRINHDSHEVNIRRHGGADLDHTLDYLTLPDWPPHLAPLDDGQGQLDVDRFCRYNQSLQEFFDEAAAVETRFVA